MACRFLSLLMVSSAYLTYARLTSMLESILLQPFRRWYKHYISADIGTDGKTDYVWPFFAFGPETLEPNLTTRQLVQELAETICD